MGGYVSFDAFYDWFVAYVDPNSCAADSNVMTMQDAKSNSSSTRGTLCSSAKRETCIPLIHKLKRGVWECQSYHSLVSKENYLDSRKPRLECTLEHSWISTLEHHARTQVPLRNFVMLRMNVWDWNIFFLKKSRRFLERTVMVVVSQDPSFDTLLNSWQEWVLWNMILHCSKVSWTKSLMPWIRATITVNLVHQKCTRD